MPQKNDLTDSQQALSLEIIRLCEKEHGSHPVLGWEFSLWKASTGHMQIKSVSYEDMTRLLSLAQKAGGWLLWSNGIHEFYPISEWIKLTKRMEGKNEEP